MDLLAIILACSLYPDDDLVRALAEIQSNGNVFFVGDLSTLKTNDSLVNAADALHAAEEIVRHGGRPAVGLLGVPLDWANRFGRAPSDLFDACTNVAVGTAVLAEYADQCLGARPPASAKRAREHRHERHRASASYRNHLRACVLERFSHALGLEGAPGVVLEAIMAKRRAAPRDGDLPPHASPIFDARSWDAEGVQRMSGIRNDDGLIVARPPNRP